MPIDLRDSLMRGRGFLRKLLASRGAPFIQLSADMTVIFDEFIVELSWT